MRTRHIEFYGPTLRPLRKWFVGGAILGLALAGSHGLPLWVQDLGWAFGLFLLLAGSARVLWIYFKHGRWVGQYGVLPKSLARWLFDMPESTKRSERRCPPGRSGT